MAEIQLTKIKSIYGDIKGLLSQIPLPNQDSYISSFIVKQFNSSIDEHLSKNIAFSLFIRISVTGTLCTVVFSIYRSFGNLTRDVVF